MTKASFNCRQSAVPNVVARQPLQQRLQEPLARLLPRACMRLIHCTFGTASPLREQFESVCRPPLSQGAGWFPEALCSQPLRAGGFQGHHKLWVVADQVVVPPYNVRQLLKPAMVEEVVAVPCNHRKARYVCKRKDAKLHLCGTRVCCLATPVATAMLIHRQVV